MGATPTMVALRAHVAGPPEREGGADNAAGWRWVQRCLRCDEYLDSGGVWWLLGSVIYEIDDGSMTSEPTPTQRADSAAPCTPED